PGRARAAVGALRDPGGDRATAGAAGPARAGPHRASEDEGAPRARARRLRPGRRRPLRECVAPRLARPLALARAEPPGGARGAPRPSAAGALLLLFGALGCGRDSRGGVVVELWAMGREGEVVAELMPGFERRHPGLRVRVQQIPWSAAHEKLVTAYVGGAMPDVFQAGNTWLPEFAALDALEPLDDRIARSPALVRGDYFPGILHTNVIHRATYGVPA